VNAAHAGLGGPAGARPPPHQTHPPPPPPPRRGAGGRGGGRRRERRVSGAGPPVGGAARLVMGGGANGPTIGGGTPLAPRARPDDGELDVVVVAALGPAARGAFGAALRAGTHVDRDDVWYL